MLKGRVTWKSVRPAVRVQSRAHNIIISGSKSVIHSWWEYLVQYNQIQEVDFCVHSIE